MIRKQKKGDINIEGDFLYQINNLIIQEIIDLRQAELKIYYFNVQHLTQKAKNQIQTVLMQNVFTFSESYQTTGQTSLNKPKIKLHHDSPIQGKPQEYAKEEINKLSEADIIIKSDSHYVFSDIFIKKKTAD